MENHNEKMAQNLVTRNKHIHKKWDEIEKSIERRKVKKIRKSNKNRTKQIIQRILLSDRKIKNSSIETETHQNICHAIESTFDGDINATELNSMSYLFNAEDNLVETGILSSTTIARNLTLHQEVFNHTCESVKDIINNVRKRVMDDLMVCLCF